MSIFQGVVVFLVALLVLRALIVWSRKYGPIGGFAESLIGYFVLPAVVGALVTGLILALSDVRGGATLVGAGATAVAIAVFYGIWRALDALPERRGKHPQTTGPGSDHPKGPRTTGTLDRAA